MPKTLSVAVMSQLPPPIHGSTVMTQTLLAALDSLGHATHFIDKGFSRSLADIGRFRWSKLRSLPGRFRAADRALRAAKPDLCVFYLTCGRFSLLQDAALLGLLSLHQCPTVLYLHGRGYAALANESVSTARLVRWVFRRAIHVVTLTPRLNQDVEQFVPASRISSVPNAISWAPSPTRKTHTSQPIRGLFLSNFDRAKGALEVVRAAHQLKHLRRELRLVLCGGVTDPTFHAELQRSITELDVGDFVELRGPAYGDEKDHILASADFLVFPTSYPLETFGLVNLEAMRAGLPVIATNVGGIPDVVVHGETGLLIAPGDIAGLVRSIETFVKDPALRQNMGGRGRARFEKHFTLDRYATNWSEVLQSLTARRA